MANRRYLNSKARELAVKRELEKQGYFVVRAAGSKGFADLVAIGPGEGEYFTVRFIQIKTSETLKEEKVDLKPCMTAFGYVQVEFRKYPVKNARWREDTRRRKAKAKARLSTQ